MRKWRTYLLVACLSFGIIPVASANTVVSQTNFSASLEMDVQLAKQMSLEMNFDIAATDITVMREEGFDYDDVVIAYVLANQSKKPVIEVITLKKGKRLGWYKIAQRYGLEIEGAQDRAFIVLERAKMHDHGKKLKHKVKYERDNEDHDQGKGNGRGKKK